MVAERNEIEQGMVGDPAVFAIGYTFKGDGGDTELALYAGGQNLLAYTENGEARTTRYEHLGSLIDWLRRFARELPSDPYPQQAEGEFAVQKDAVAREFISDDPVEMDEYYFTILDWCYNHSWIGDRDGATVPYLLFEVKDGNVEISWDNRQKRNGIVYACEFGGVRVPADVFADVVLKFTEAFERRWGLIVITNFSCGM